jgi:hypothetical protein
MKTKNKNKNQLKLVTNKKRNHLNSIETGFKKQNKKVGRWQPILTTTNNSKYIVNNTKK